MFKLNYSSILLKFFLVGFVIFCGGCRVKSPAPPELIDRLKSFVENEGHPAENVFSVPDGMGSASSTSRDKIEVKSIKYASSMPPLSENIGQIPAGTVVFYYNVKLTRTHPDGSEVTERQIFYVYQDASGEWCFIKLNRPEYSTD